MRRSLTGFLIALSLSSCFAGCENRTAKQLDEARKQVEQLESQIDELKSDLSNLEHEVNRFDYADWKDVVPRVKEGVSDAQRNSESLADTAEELTLILAVNDADEGSYEP